MESAYPQTGAIAGVDQVLKVELTGEACCVCGVSGEELFSPEEHDAAAPHHLPPLRAMLLHLNHSKTVPSGQLCSGCIRKATEAYHFSTTLAAKGPPLLSEKIKALRKRLHELTQKIDVFIVVGGGGADGAYNEEDIIMVERAAVAAACRGDEAELARTRDLKGESVYQCTVCPLTFQRASEYQRHADTHAADSVHSCWTCGAQHASREAAAAHRDSHQHPPRCHLCTGTFQSVAELRRHETSCPPICPVCGARAESLAALRAHAALHATLCAHCFQTLGTADELHAHLLAHRQEKQFVCGYDGCILRFQTRSQLVSHIRKWHGAPLPAPDLAPAPAPAADPAQVPCPHCPRTFASAAAMKRHARVHKTETEQPPQEDMEWKAEEMEETEERVEYLEMEALEDIDEEQSL